MPRRVLTGGPRNAQRLLVLSALLLGNAVGLLISTDLTHLVVGAGLGVVALILAVIWGQQRQHGHQQARSTAGVWAAVFIVGLAGVRVALSAAESSASACSTPTVEVVAAIQATSDGAAIPGGKARAVHDNNVRELLYVAAVVDQAGTPAVWTVDTGLGDQVHPLNPAASALSRDTPAVPAQYTDAPGAARAARCATDAAR